METNGRIKLTKHLNVKRVLLQVTKINCN